MTPASGLLTDLYTLTMAEAYLRAGETAEATFSLFVRRLPANRGYLIAAGLADLVEFLENWRFLPDELDYLRDTGLFSAALLDYLAGLRFTGLLRAIPEGRLVFADEPLVELTAPIITAQILETATINLLQLQTMQATKASRCVLAANGRPVADFSLRRTHGFDAGLAAARAGYLAGMRSTSDVLAGRHYGIPVSGTMAHSFVGAFGSEAAAFRAFAAAYPRNTTLLIDTFDTRSGAEEAIQVAREMAARGDHLRFVRIDSGDYRRLCREVREMLDAAGFGEIGIFVSGGMDEYEIEALLAAGTPVDGFGVGTAFGCVADAPYLEIAYKLVQYRGRPIIKTSPGKESWAAPKQVWRRRDGGGRLVGDTLGLASEHLEGEPLLETVMDRGVRVRPLPGLEESRARCAAELAALPEEHRRLREPAVYPVAISAGLAALQDETRRAQRIPPRPGLPPRD